MEGGIKNFNLPSPEVDIKNKVMEKIKAEDIKMKNPLIFLAEKIGLQSVLLASILCGAFIVAVILYILKKIGTLQFLKLGVPGLKVILLSAPYDYIALLLFTVILGTYIIHLLDFSRGIRNYFNAPALALLVVTVFIGAFFAIMGGEQFLRGLYENRSVSKEIAVTGKVLSAASGEVTIQEEDGKLEKIVFNNGNSFPYTPDYAVGKILRAVGQQDPKNPGYFHAQDINCCEGN